MRMSEDIVLLLNFSAGILFGVMFFGGLWWTLLKGLSAKQPALWFAGGFLIRTSVLLAGFYFVASGHWQRLVICLLGFILARFIILRLIRTPAEARAASGEEACDAS